MDDDALLRASLSHGYQEATAALAEAQAALAHVRALHPSYEEARAAECVICLECAQVAPCRTRRELDGRG